MLDLRNNIEIVRENIAKAAQYSGRKPEDITLVAVTKTIDIGTMHQAISLGIKNIGENKVQEILNKYDNIDEDNIKWHLIGHLQTNKVKYIIDKVDLIHSVDSFKLAEEINKRALKINRKIDILIQVNVSEEKSKFGVEIKNCEKLLLEISQLSNVKIKGLMTIAPNTSICENARPFFRNLKHLSIDIMKKNYDNISMKYLSMGMTGDYIAAIEEGANLVRIGTAIFGHRPNNQFDRGGLS
ncbi:MAG: YggS family pyridoxal phosphate-dependent enzyme [Clostridia bacterium]